jgi:benzodiazapine receptor
MLKRGQIVKLLVSILIVLLAGFIGSIFTSPSIPTWYASLQKPAFNPPNWLFAPAWTILYVLMGISAYLIWDKGFKKKGVRIALIVFAVQLVLNSLWSVLFFGLHSPLYAFIEIIFLWIAILFTILKFYKISKTAAYLLIPYICWVTFASVLNYYVLILN